MKPSITIRLAVTICTALFMSCSGQKTVYLSDFMTDSGQQDAMGAIRMAIEECRKVKASELVLPEGTLRIMPDKAFEKYQFISNNDENLKRIAFDLEDMEDFTIKGQDTKLLFTGFISPFSLERCKNVRIENLSIDFTRTFHSEGMIEAAGQDYLDVRFPEEYRCNIINGCLYFTDENHITYNFSNLLEFDSQKKEPAYLAQDYWLSKSTVPAEMIDGNLIRIFKKNLKGNVGNTMVFGAAARYNPGFFVSDCSGITLDKVNIWHCGGMGVIAQRSRDIELNNVYIVPSPGSGRMISITADATHFVNCAGYIRMIDCKFCNQKDDATNIHGLYMIVDEIIAPNKLLLEWRNSGQYGIDFLKPGMTVEIVDNNTVVTYCHATVKNVERLNRTASVVTFEQPLPEGIRKEMAIAADEEYPEVLIKGCHMSGNRARGLLLGSRAEMIIEDCYFHIPGAAILLEGDCNFWFEQSGVRDVKIRRNIFENGNYGYSAWGAACISVGSRIPDLSGSECYHRNILIEDNIFRVFDPRILNLFSVDNVTFRNNTIEMTNAYPYQGKETRNFVYDNCRNIVIE
ncbi:MAG: right-handed parallel beta-helix repeat-containing protein [Bacteroidales bacterium]|nr:right-handed parallel beta-helix repeat-containing protein [Bacteroidales bacterium]